GGRRQDRRGTSQAAYTPSGQYECTIDTHRPLQYLWSDGGRTVAWRVCMRVVVGVASCLLTGLVFADEGPSIVPTSIVVRASSHDGFAKKPTDHYIRSWTPRIQLTVRGPAAPGGQLVAEFFQGKQVWVSIGMLVPELAEGKSATLEGGSDVPRDSGSIATGAIPFQLRLRNELMGAAKGL